MVDPVKASVEKVLGAVPEPVKAVEVPLAPPPSIKVMTQEQKFWRRFPFFSLLGTFLVMGMPAIYQDAGWGLPYDSRITAVWIVAGLQVVVGIATWVFSFNDGGESTPGKHQQNAVLAVLFGAGVVLLFYVIMHIIPFTPGTPGF